MRKLSFIALLLLLSAPAFAQRYLLVPQSTEIGFTIGNGLFGTAEGKFSKFEAELDFNAQNLAASSLSATIMTESIDTNNGMRDGHLRGKKYFNCKQYPTMSFQSSVIQKTADGYLAKGYLTIRGITQEVEIPFQKEEQGGLTYFKGAVTIDRLSFKVGGKHFMIGDEIAIELKVAARLNPEAQAQTN